MHSVPSLHDFVTSTPSSSSFHGGSSSHRLKHLQKSDRRVVRIYIAKEEIEKVCIYFCSLFSLPLEEILANRTFDLNKISFAAIHLCMEIRSGIAKSASEVVKNFLHLPVKQSQLNYDSSEKLPVDDLGNDLSKFVNIQKDKNLSTGSMQVCGNNSVGKVDSVEDPHPHSSSTSEKFLGKSASFPCSDSVSPCGVSISMEDGGTTVIGESGDSPYPRSMSLPTPLKLVPAMKGSREKHGFSHKKLNVTWAPDVYDPTPTAASHVVTNKSPGHRNDSKKSKNSKNRQRGGGKSSVGTRGKDKKQARRYSWSSDKCFKQLDDSVRAVDQVEHRADMDDFKIGSPDPYWRTNFPKNNVAELHFSVAEAT